MERNKVLEITDLSYMYRGNWLVQRVQALKGVSLDVHEGEAFGFVGHNGAGKTTAIKCVLGLLRPHSGSIKIFGAAHTDSEQRRLIGYIPEQPYFYDHLTVTELIVLNHRS